MTFPKTTETNNVRRIFAIGDLHLSHEVPDKAMDVFGAHWQDHAARIRDAWQATVGQDDLVLLPGDFSWAMHLNDTKADFQYLSELNGKKVLLRGNHDYWWSSITKVRSVLPEGVYAVQNDVLSFGSVHVGGTRGWLLPHTNAFSEQKDRKIYEREVGRLRLSLDAMPEEGLRIVMLHYPPFAEDGTPSDFVPLLEQANVHHVVYGHLHGKTGNAAFEGERNGIFYHLVSSDRLQFCPKHIITPTE